MLPLPHMLDNQSSHLPRTKSIPRIADFIAPRQFDKATQASRDQYNYCLLSAFPIRQRSAGAGPCVSYSLVLIFVYHKCSISIWRWKTERQEQRERGKEGERGRQTDACWAASPSTFFHHQTHHDRSSDCITILLLIYRPVSLN